MVNATWIEARPQWYFSSIGLTKSVQPYCRLATLAMQMMPIISCIHGDANADLVPVADSIVLSSRVAGGRRGDRRFARQHAPVGAVWLFSDLWHNVCGISVKVNRDLRSSRSTSERQVAGVLASSIRAVHDAGRQEKK